jgi:drug/metabolite transporter (DMT)-like permease
LEEVDYLAQTQFKKHMPSFALMLTAIIWGAGFIGVQMAIDSGFSSGLILFCRFSIASAILLGFFSKKIFPLKKQDIIYSLIAASFLFIGFYAQTIGLTFTTPSNNGFFTSTNVIMVPFIAWILHRRRPPAKIWFCALMALTGFFVLSYHPAAGFSVNIGDLLTVLSAFFFACHIAGLGIISPRVETFKLTFLQMVFGAAFALLGMLIFEPGSLAAADFSKGWGAVLFLGVFPTCVCFFLQFWAQAKTNSGKAALLLSGEALWCAVFSVMLGYEVFSSQMILGGLLIVGATVLLEMGGRRQAAADMLPATHL